ncbi:MAG: PEP-CTERM sorting domain-containing protein [Methylococcaceae bacterium]|nr:PEP-CTERM sorting domain-containing protein [Methylococcaceae bacterium]
MKKVFKYLAVIALLTGASVANAGAVLASSAGASGTVAVTGFNDVTPNIISIVLDYNTGSTIAINSDLYAGQEYKFSSTYSVNAPGLGALALAPTFNVIAQTSVGPNPALALETFFANIFPATVSGSPLGIFTLGNSTLSLSSVTRGTAGAHTTLTLDATVLSGNISTVLTNVALLQGTPGSANATFSNGTIAVTPEPATFLLMGAGLVGLAASKKRKAA